MKYFNDCCSEYIDSNLSVQDGEIQEMTCAKCGQKIIGYWGDSYGLWLPKAIKKEDYKK